MTCKSALEFFGFNKLSEAKALLRVMAKPNFKIENSSKDLKEKRKKNTITGFEILQSISSDM